MLCLLLCACGDTPDSSSVSVSASASASAVASSQAAEEIPSSAAAESTESEAPAAAAESAPETDTSESDVLPDKQTDSTFSLDSIPEYTDEPYAEVNGNQPYFTQEEKSDTSVFETYSELDALGRCGVAYANICQELMPTEERGEIGSIKPTGWHLAKYDWVDGKYLYNRCHLIGYQLAGENANEKNLITGTRYLNVTGMLPFENLTADYVESTGNHVLYRVTPVFVDDELLARGVLMEAWSVEDSGAGVCFCAFVYNVEPGVIIDYATGDNQADENYVVPTDENASDTEDAQEVSGNEVQDASQSATDTNGSDSSEISYVLNTRSMKFHYPDCSGVASMSEKNRQDFTGTRDEAIAMGYSPCGTCKP